MIETRHECGPGKPTPENGLCSGAYVDPSGWKACLTWKHDDPKVSHVEFWVRAPLPLTCEMIGASQLGHPWGSIEEQGSGDGWSGRLCTLPEYGISIDQKRPLKTGAYAGTEIKMYSMRFIEFDKDAAQDFARRQKQVGL